MSHGFPGYWSWDDDRTGFRIWGKRGLAGRAAQPPMGTRLLGPLQGRLAMDLRLLGGT